MKRVGRMVLLYQLHPSSKLAAQWGDTLPVEEEEGLKQQTLPQALVRASVRQTFMASSRQVL